MVMCYFQSTIKLQYHLDLITEAQTGNSSCLNSLAILVKQKIYTYLCRTNIHFDVYLD